MAEKKFPERLFVKREEDGGSSWFVADDNNYDLAEIGTKIKIGVYQLVNTETVEFELVIKTSK